MKIRKDRPEKKLVINVPPVIQRLSTFEIIKRSVWFWLDRKTTKKASAKDPGAGMPNMQSWSNISHFAIVVGDDVMDVMHVQPKMAAWLQSNPKFVMFDAEDGFPPMPGFRYVDGKFVDPNINLDIEPQKFSLKKENNE
jgi:hypothetical protein